jgi:hypothetical protein
MVLVPNRLLGSELTKRGLVPAHCRLFEVVVQIDGSLTIRYERFVPAEELDQLGDIFKAVAHAIAEADRQKEA